MTQQEQIEEINPNICANPFIVCISKHSEHIAATIRKDGKDYPICRECWDKIADSEFEWSTPQPRISEQKDNSDKFLKMEKDETVTEEDA